MLVDGSGLSGPSGLSGEMADRYLRKSVSICGSFVVRVYSRAFAVPCLSSLRPFAAIPSLLSALGGARLI